MSRRFPIHLAAALAALLLALPASAQVAIEFSEGQEAVPELGAGDSALYTSCYFRNGGKISFGGYGKTKDKTLYNLNGILKKTPATRTWKYFARSDLKEMRDACVNLKNQWKLKGDLVAFFASEGTHNYYIIKDKKELYPDF